MEGVNVSHIKDLLLLARHTDVIHHIPGRIRLRARPSILQVMRGKNVQGMVKDIPGLLNVRVRPLVGSVVIEYDREKLPYALWERLSSLQEFNLSEIEELLKSFGLAVQPL